MVSKAGGGPFPGFAETLQPGTATLEQARQPSARLQRRRVETVQHGTGMAELGRRAGQVAGAGDGEGASDAFHGGGARGFSEDLDPGLVPGRVDLCDTRCVRPGPVALPAIGPVCHHPYSTPPVLRPVERL